ncbi:MAG: glycoside hydrolase family 32 protein [Ardenticatenaceae bacterium]|nr:glycoside hydrolase family 32 protein [Ardenticatenaceae bacterium]
MTQVLYAEPYRPQYHFTPVSGWMNDPNGLLFYDGEYHLYYQAIPHSHESEGPKHWGLAISSDLVHWRQMPTALAPDGLGEIWSGSAVVDWHNSCGLQSGAEKVLVALYTNFTPTSQQQSMAFSVDRGRSWVKYAGNPVIPNGEHRDFRDPKVFWHQASERWVAILVAGHQTMIYTSADLKVWTFASAFGMDEVEGGVVWECPDLFPLAVDGDAANKKWVMLVSLWGGVPNGGTATRYFVGDFDGRSFTNTSPPQTVRWLDYGCDNYATITFSDVPNERRVGIGWMSNWLYAGKTPTAPWRSAMTVPRELSLVTDADGVIQLVTQPINELECLRGEAVVVGEQVVGETAVLSDIPLTGAFEILLDCDLETAQRFSLSLKNELGEVTVVGYERENGRLENGRLFVDRRESGQTNFSPDFAADRHTAPWQLQGNKLRLHLFVDWSSVEVFVDNGRLALTEQIFPSTPYNQVVCQVQGGSARILHCQIWPLHSIWPQ